MKWGLSGGRSRGRASFRHPTTGSLFVFEQAPNLPSDCAQEPGFLFILEAGPIESCRVFQTDPKGVLLPWFLGIHFVGFVDRAGRGRGRSRSGNRGSRGRGRRSTSQV